MNADQENFESLRKLLAFKKYEQPPPRYFSELPGRIWVRLEREPAALPFWQRLFPNIGLSPAFAYGFGLLACSTLFFGVAYSLKTEPEPTLAFPLANENWQTVSPRLATTEGTGSSLAPNRSIQFASTNPLVNASELQTLLEGMRPRQERMMPQGFTPVNYSP